MARPLRIQYPDAVYHVTCRGNERQVISKDDADRARFLQILTQSLNIYTVKLHTYVLMNNHFLLLVETPLGNLTEFMRKFNITYTLDPIDPLKPLGTCVIQLACRMGAPL